ncbi:MAG: GNAT family N-acetyltransferase [Geminicoccaceae bacterium]
MVENEALIRQIEEAAWRAWPAARTALLAGWRLRAGPTATRRENSVQAMSFTGELAPDAAIRSAEAWYAAAGKPACFQLNALSAPLGLDAALAGRGYAAEGWSTVLVRPLDTLPEEPAKVVLEGRATAFAMQAVADPRWPAAERAARAALFARIRRPLAFAVRTVGGEPVAGGLCVFDGPLAGLAAMRTATTARRQGHGRAVLDRLLVWAGRMGAGTAWLQVEADNAPAAALYRSAGFLPLYDYHYRVAGAAGTG